ncbi:Ribosomal protein S18 acetylase RimI [Luteibacter sp. UNCMF331Sha3.1]|jgi:ribosomal protein S18 acetylase RimI-like enzyme|uniref:GNAT family N-acetyltransferase n=1 Tax=Luteibacter sp. UNCMF331Sha3.1 TaxID=1502760 RepID=UPI0008BED05E|nr:GNAT family N-acetyltransferase [Luteibacter sp. UNCMF331Sha3.1]SEN42348.1 Ribosomal protein S18 acetylase RimI [Luteibacter sp. UNCMF331Sha3.1]
MTPIDTSAPWVRPATIDDLDALSDLFNQYRMFYDQADDRRLARDFLAERMTRDESVVFVVPVADGLAGFAQLYPTFSSVSGKRAWILNDLFVSPHHRRQGVAGALLARCLAHARDSGSAWLTLSTAVDNDAAQALYRRFGFEQERKYLTFSHALS